MSDSEQVSCSLEPNARSARTAQIVALGRRALIDADIDATTARLRFAADDGVRAELEAIVAAEARCCPFFEMTVGERDGAIELEVFAPDAAQPEFAWLAASFSGRR